ncbi:hypothetical protein Slin15195_G111080 [Septoria linicola]|uniref:Uncharacterized protein n=1 Tax=Septoria linicola TaxID=215465 RepID=A0A9Q9AZ14_9PEZI|nr:hypothetical protein Slin15195_G111080 [Septoria linicola]
MTSAHGSSAGLGILPSNGVLSATRDQKARYDPSIPPVSGICRWHDMPVEIRDMVFELAYGPYGLFKPVTRNGWDRAEKVRRREKRHMFQARTFPSSFINQFMVDREWLLLALQLFFKGTTFQFSDSGIEFVEGSKVYTFKSAHNEESQSKTSKMRPIGLRKSHTSGFITSISIPVWSDDCRELFTELYPNLKEVCLRLQVYFFHFADKSIKERLWLEEDFGEHEDTNEILKACDYFSMSVEPIHASYEKQAARSTFARNIETLNSMLRSRPVLPRAPASGILRSSSPISDDFSADLDLDDVLSASPMSRNAVARPIAAPRMSATLPMTSARNALRDVDIPLTEEAFAQLVFKRGPDVFKWARDILDRVK